MEDDKDQEHEKEHREEEELMKMVPSKEVRVQAVLIRSQNMRRNIGRRRRSRWRMIRSNNPRRNIKWRRRS